MDGFSQKISAKSGYPEHEDEAQQSFKIKNDCQHSESAKTKITDSSEKSRTINTVTTPFILTGRNQDKPKPLPCTVQLKSVAVQPNFNDEDMFPPLDYRRCTRCGKNDAISPGLCIFKSRCINHEDQSNMISLKSRDRVEYSHVYKPTDENHSIDGGILLFKTREKISQESSKSKMTTDQGCQTIVGIAEVRSMAKGSLKEYKCIDKVLLSPKDL